MNSETENTFTPTEDLDGEYTMEQLEQRMAYCEERAEETHPIFSSLPAEYANQYAARLLYLEQQQEVFADSEEKTYTIHEQEYEYMLESLLEDGSYYEIYENGDNSMYSWQLWAYTSEVSNFHYHLNQWRLKEGLEPPSWVGDNICYYEEEE